MKLISGGIVAIAAMLAVLLLGPASMADVAGYERVTLTSNETFSPSQTYTLSAHCPEGKVLLGGGFGAISLGGSTPVHIHQAGSIDEGHFYRVRFRPSMTFSGFYVQAICADAASL
jgi:hypothetical protein